MAAKLTLPPEHLAQLEQVSVIAPNFAYTVLEGPRPLYTGGKVDLFDAPANCVA